MMQHQSFSRRPWWLMLGFLLLAGVLMSLAACAPGGSASQGTSSNPATQSTAPATPTQAAGNAEQGTLKGSVVASPGCPVETPDRPCPPKPVPNRALVVELPDGKAVATVMTDQDGHFSVNLAPGKYLLKMAATDDNPYPIQRQPVTVTIVAGQTTTVQVVLDSGIR